MRWPRASAGPPQIVANVGRPQLMASTTVSPKASYSAGCTNAPLVSAAKQMPSRQSNLAYLTPV